MRMRGLLAGFFVLATLAGQGVASAAPSSQPTIGRWFGGEAGSIEIQCYGWASDCPGFLSEKSFGGIVGVPRTHSRWTDPDGVEREWPARTGNFFFMAGSPGGGLPATATISSFGSEAGQVPAGTISFAFRTHTLPTQPVVIYRHLGELPGETPFVAITLSPDGSLLLSAAGSLLGASGPVSTREWHTVTVTYGSQANTAVKLYLDGQEPVVGSLLLPGPSGDVDLGIVTPISTLFTIGVDDFVDSPSFDAAIHGARINYLMPLGETAAGWTKSYPDPACRNAARNWQFVAEDQKVMNCDLTGSALTTSLNGVVDEYLLEGIPSRHVPSASYRRVAAQPDAKADILGMRLRMKASTSWGTPLPMYLGYTDGSTTRQETLAFHDGGTGGPPTHWSGTLATRPAGGSWTPEALGGLRLRLDSGPGLGSLTVDRTIFQVRVDYVWVP